MKYKITIKCYYSKLYIITLTILIKQVYSSFIMVLRFKLS